jgi:hypothetical protein
MSRKTRGEGKFGVVSGRRLPCAFWLWRLRWGSGVGKLEGGGEYFVWWHGVTSPQVVIIRT